MATKSKAAATVTPAAVGDTVSFTAFTAANPTVATAVDASTLANGDTLTLAATAGDPAAMAAIDGQTTTVNSVTGADVALSIDLSAVDVTGLTATGTVTDEVDPPDPPDPEPEPDPKTVLEKAFSSSPSPGVGSLPVAPNPDDTLPGSTVGGHVPDPENPTGPPLEGDRLQKAQDAFRAKQAKAMEVLGPQDELEAE